MSKVPAASDRLKVLTELQDDTRASLELAAERMKTYYDKNVSDAPVFEPGDKVWLDTKNLKLKQPSKKLSAKHVGPYEVVERIGDLDYR